MSVEAIPFVEDDPAKNAGSAVGAVIGIAFTVKTLTAPSLHRHNHYVDEVNTLYGNVQALHTSAELLGTGPETHGAVDQLNAKATTEQRTIQQLRSHAPKEPSFVGEMGAIFAPAFVTGFAMAALVHAARRAKFKERNTYANLAKVLVTESGSKRPAPTGPLFKPKEATA